MRSLVYRGAVVVLSAVVAAGAVAAPRTESRGMRTVKKIVRALGDLITIPIPPPTTPPRQP